jgi:hypothetical protein
MQYESANPPLDDSNATEDELKYKSRETKTTNQYQTTSN